MRPFASRKTRISVGGMCPLSLFAYLRTMSNYFFLEEGAPIDVTANQSRDREGAVAGRAPFFEEGSALCIRAHLGRTIGVGLEEADACPRLHSSRHSLVQPAPICVPTAKRRSWRSRSSTAGS